jgi:hypothetical protein
MTRTLPKEMVKFQYQPTKYPTPELRSKAVEMMKQGKTDTEIAKYLMWDRDVALYSTLNIIQKAKSILGLTKKKKRNKIKRYDR